MAKSWSDYNQVANLVLMQQEINIRIGPKAPRGIHASGRCSRPTTGLSVGRFDFTRRARLTSEVSGIALVLEPLREFGFGQQGLPVSQIFNRTS